MSTNSRNGWMNCANTYKMEFYTAKEMNELQVLATTWIVFTKNNAGQKNPNAKEHILNDSIYIAFK